MNRAALCIKMLLLLYAKGKMTIAEIADELETNPKNVPLFKKELETAGYDIETVRGYYGGYRLRANELFPTVRLTDAEKLAMVESFEYVTKKNELLSMPAYKTAMEKIMGANNYRNGKTEEMVFIPRYPLAMPEEELQARYAALAECARTRSVVRIQYRSNDNVVRERLIHPYMLYMYNNAWFTLAYCETVKDLRYFKLNRIVAFEVLSKRFEYIYSYREGSQWHEWLNEHGMTRNGDWYEVKLKFTGKYAMVVQDYLYGKDQITECIDQNTTVLTLKMQYKDSISNFVLGFGEFCEVLEPEWLKEDVHYRSKLINNQYR